MASRCVRCAGTGTVNAPVNGDIHKTTPVTCPSCGGTGST